MADAEYKASGAGMKALLGSPEVLAAVTEYAEGVRERAASMVSDDDMKNDAFYMASKIGTSGFARASVYTGNPHGYYATLSDNVLLKALG